MQGDQVRARTFQADHAVPVLQPGGGGLVFKAHRLLYHSALGSRGKNTKEKNPGAGITIQGLGNQALSIQRLRVQCLEIQGAGFRGVGIQGLGIQGLGFV